MPTDSTASVSCDARRVLEHRALRLGIGITVVFLVAMVYQWTLAYLAPIFLPLLLQAGRPLRVAEALKLLVAVLIVMLVSYYLAAMSRLLSPLFALLLIPMLFVTFRSLFRGGPVLIILMVLIGLVLPPLTAKLSLHGTWDISASFFWNIGLCVIVSYVLFVLFPPLPGEPEPKPRPVLPPAEADWRAAALAVIVGGYELVYLAFDWHNAHTPLYIAVFASTLGFSRTAGLAKGILAANIVGGMVAVVMFELTAAAPNFLFLVALTLPVMIVFARAVVSEAPWAPLASFAMSVVLLIFGPSISPYGSGTGFENLSYRLFELGIAAIYAVAATFVLETFRPALKP
ncbi:hypothetical protein BIT28_24520 [Photobacterium proteolyticum]|uniref:DUF2955 domain-containing protein n=1 Tax=Photobacterium proteolyticum TaxID=1903952 RepID=A0A1Q9GCS0_9GAMM|nr:DUF2955 domain-containing protein [Photobacterium proteolyticum]OLQ72190.1 hypothetical protein BIT28_24520 [Photobacterium proteolyticum]